MRIASLSLAIAAGLATAAQAQTPAAPATTPPAPTTASSSTAQVPPSTAAAPAGAPVAPAPGVTPAAPGTATPAAPATGTAVAPAAAPPAAAPAAAAPAEAPPTLPTTGDGAVIVQVLDKVCVPLVRGGNLDQLAKAMPGARKDRRDGTWSIPLGGKRDYQVILQPPGVNKTTCLAEVHYAIGQDQPIVDAVNVWSFLHKPELVLQANYVNVDPDGIKRVRKSWEHLESNSDMAVNFTTERKPDGQPLNRNYDVGELFYQERQF